MRNLKTKFHTISWQVQQKHEITLEQAIEVSVKTLLEIITPEVKGSRDDKHYFAYDGTKYRLCIEEDSYGRGSNSERFVRYATPEETKVLEVIEMLKSKGECQ